MFLTFSFLIIHNTLSPNFEVMVGSAGYGSTFPWDANSFALSLQFLPTVLPMCLEDQDKYPCNEWLTEKESEILWTYFSTTSPGRVTPQVPVACRVRDDTGFFDTDFHVWLSKTWLNQPEMSHADHRCEPVLRWRCTPVCNLPVTGIGRTRSSDSCSQNCY